MMVTQTRSLETVSAQHAAREIGVHYVTLRRWLASKKFRLPSGGLVLDGGKHLWRFTPGDLKELRIHKMAKYCTGRGRKARTETKSVKKRKVPMHSTRDGGLTMKWHVVMAKGYPVVHGFINGEQCMTWQLKVNSRAAGEKAVHLRLDEILQENHAKKVNLAVAYLRQYSDTRTAKRAAITDGQISENDDYTWSEAIYRCWQEKSAAKALARVRKADKKRLPQP
jgi:hypothetical protein